MWTLKTFRNIAIPIVLSFCLAVQAFAAPSSVTVKKASKTFKYNGASGSVAFTVTGTPHDQVTVNASSNAAWITIDAGYQSKTYTLNAKGKASGSVKYHVDSYAASSPSRQGTIDIGNATFTVDQTGAPCVISISPAKSTYDSTGDTGNVNVTAPQGCQWSATISSGSAWISFDGASTGNGSAILSYIVAANNDEHNRNGKIVLAPNSGKGKKTHTVTQSASSNNNNSSGGQILTPEYVVFAWNDLGMHCLNPTYDDAVILPPYNTLWAQVVHRGNPPVIVTSGIQIDYRILNNTYSYGKRYYGQFWDNMLALFRVTLPRDKGLNLEDPTVNNGLTGTMLAKGDHFQANGIPLTPVEDGGTWNPFQVAEVTVRDSGTGQILAQTRTTAPTSDEIDCNGCHGVTVDPILTAHDNLSGTSLQTQKPVLCASCHASPALGSAGQPGVKYLSESIHTFHGSLGANQPTCYNCHPGATTQCNRSLRHTAPDGNCTTCHGTLAQVGASVTAGRVPWASEPACSTCHGGTTIPEVSTGTTLYRNSIGHGGMRCSSCHSSPHAMVPSRVASDNYQAVTYQGKAVTIGSCAACHNSSHGGGDLNEFSGEHAGTNPKHLTACHVCHTAVSNTPTLWPHSFKWIAR